MNLTISPQAILCVSRPVHLGPVRKPSAPADSSSHRWSNRSRTLLALTASSSPALTLEEEDNLDWACFLRSDSHRELIAPLPPLPLPASDAAVAAEIVASRLNKGEMLLWNECDWVLFATAHVFLSRRDVRDFMMGKEKEEEMELVWRKKSVLALNTGQWMYVQC